MQHHLEFHRNRGYSDHLLVWSPYSYRDEFQREMDLDLSASLTKGYFGLNSAVQSKRMKNASVPISSLSVELLSRIFRLTQYKLPEELSTLIRVCHHWRDVALNTAHLWTRIPCNDPFDMEAHLKRSKSLALDVTLIYSSEEEFPADPESPVYVLNHLHRVERLTVELLCEDGTPGSFKTFNALCHRPAPQLHFLELTSESAAWGDIESTALIFPNANICHLKLCHVEIPLNSHLFSDNLTYLHLQQFMELTRQELRDLLKRMHRLEYLFLEDVVQFRYDPSEEPNIEPTRLPSLQVLTVIVEEEIMCIADFFKLVIFPGSLNALRIRAGLGDGDESMQSVQEMIRACTDWEAFWSSDVHTLKIGVIDIEEGTYLRFQGFTKDGTARLSMELPFRAFMAPETGMEIHSMLYTSGAHSIKSVSWDFATGKEVMCNTFRQCPDIEEVCVSSAIALYQLSDCLGDRDLHDVMRRVNMIVVVGVEASEEEQTAVEIMGSDMFGFERLVGALRTQP